MLYADANKIGDGGFAILLNKSLNKVEELIIGTTFNKPASNGITSVGMKSFLTIPPDNLNNLKNLYLSTV